MALGIVFSAAVFLLLSPALSSAQVRDVVICKSPAKSADASDGKKSAGRSVRTLRVYETKEKNEKGESADGCRATYSKTNVEQTVGTSRQVQQCQTILSGIQNNLEASHWTCRHAGAMGVMKSSAAETSEASSSAAAAPGPSAGPTAGAAAKDASVVR
jgi:hypothetical protein